MTPREIATSLENLRLERDAIVLYDRLSAIEKDPRRAAAFRTIAVNERRHAEIWARRLAESGVDVPPTGAPRARIRFILLLARLLGTRAVSDLVKALEGDEEATYADQDHPEVAAIAADERLHAEIWRRLDAGLDGHGPAVPLAEDVAIHRAADGHLGPGSGPEVAPSAAADAAPAAGSAGLAAGAVREGASSGHVAPRDESWHRAGQTGTLRATIFGVNDGLVSNLSLVMGVSGAQQDNHIIVLAGIAGLVAGAFSMAAGEWISMQSQRELFERQIALEREELRVMPEVEERELARIFRRKGLPEEDARRTAAHLMEDPEAALDTKVREELGLDPDELGSPWGAAIGSFLAFAAGAFVPLLPFLMASGTAATVAALALAFAALFGVGAAVSLLTGRSTLFSGARQVAIGAGAAAVTYGVGSIIGVQLAP
ncbi:MAG TPA: VIT1/CCC1 transporter family protein [Candidatus Limnocylindrales bacterium]|nr:VIT1/CCC1 transporter family protein [Candidatus Limnocylindrales bacterium]